MIRLSGLLANRPAPAAALKARYYATDNSTIYFSTGGSWQTAWPLDQSDAAGFFGGPLAQRPTPDSCVGWVFFDSATGNPYEAFPANWAALSSFP